jgi:hypothetical protein
MGQSRLPHVAGGRFIQIHDWAVKAVGLGGAAVLGLIDFLDRNQVRPNKPIATRLDISAALQGIVGRDAVDRALRDLADMGWIKRTTHRHKNNPAELYKFALNAEAIESYINAGSNPPKCRKTPSGIQDGAQFDVQDNPNGCKEVGREPPPQKLGKAIGGGGENIDSEEKQSSIKSEISPSDSGPQKNIIPELATFLTGLHLDEFTLKRAYTNMQILTSEQQTVLLDVSRRTLPRAKDVSAYLMTLISTANSGGLTTQKAFITESNNKSNESSLMMTEAEVTQHTKGKTLILKDEKVIAEVMYGALYLNGCRYDQSRASKILRDVNAGSLTMR